MIANNTPELDGTQPTEGVVRVALPPLVDRFRSTFGYTHPERDKREMCPFCKNEDTRRLNGLELMPFEEYHGQNPFRAFDCSACGGQFHYAINATTQAPL